MPVPWWAKISPDFYKRDSGINEAIAPRMREMRAVIADTRLKDEPSVAAAFLNSNVPVSVAQRIDLEYRRVKAGAQQQLAGAQGMPNNIDRQTALTPMPPKPPERSWMQDPVGVTLGTLGDIGGGALDAAAGFGRGIVTGIFEAANATFSPLTVPVAAGLANSPLNPNETQYNLVRPGDPRAPAPTAPPNKWALAEAARNGDKNAEAELSQLPSAQLPNNRQNVIASGVQSVIGTRPLTPGQQADMRSQGFDPESFGDRYSWYYSSMEPGQKAIADSDVEYFSQVYDPAKVQLTREILTSNALNDGNLDGLSAEAKAFAESVTSETGDPQDKQLFQRMSHSSSLYLGSEVANMMGIPRGTTNSMIVSAMSDLAFYWYADPIRAATAGARAYRIANYGASAGDIASAENMLRAVKVPGDVHSPAATAAGRAMNELITTVEEMNRFRQSANATPETKAAMEIQGSQLLEQFRIRHPDMVQHLGLITQGRNGRIGEVTIKSMEDIKKAEAELIAKGKPFDSLTVTDPTVAGKPWYTLTRGADGQYTNESLNIARNVIVDKMSEFIFREAIAAGRPFHNSIALLPGMVAVNRNVRARIVPIRDALTLANRSIYRALDDTKGIKPVNFTGNHVNVSDLFLSDAAGAWTAANYTQKWTTTLEKALSRIDKSYSGQKFTFNGPESVESYRRFVTSMFPKHQANSLTIAWMNAGPAERMAQYRQTVEAFVGAANFKTDPIAREITDLLTKGVVPQTNRGARHAPNEVYTANKVDNTIDAGGHEIAAAVWPYQLSDGVTLPWFRGIRVLQEKTGLLSAVTGLFHTRIVNAATAAWKVGKVGNPANMSRQMLELVAMGGLEQGLSHTLALLKNRRWTLAQTLTERVARNDLDRAATTIREGKSAKLGDALRQKSLLTGQDEKLLHDSFQAGDWDAVRHYLTFYAKQAGATDREVAQLVNLADGISYQTLVDGTRLGPKALAFLGPLDALRNVRIAYLKRTGGTSSIPDTQWHQYLDAAFLNAMTKRAIGDFGANANDALLLTGGAVADDLAQLAVTSMGGSVARVANSRQWLGTQGDAGAQNWMKEFDSRQTDVIGGEVMRALAIEVRNGSNKTVGELLNDAAAQTKRSALYPTGTQLPVYPTSIDSAAEVAQFLLSQSKQGERFRNEAMRLMYTAKGSRVVGQQELDEAIVRAGAAMLRDAALHMGAEARTVQAGRIHFDPAYYGVLDKMADSGRVRLSDLQAIDEKVRPQSISAALYIPAVGRAGGPDRVVELASKAYNLTVAKPLQQLAITPEFLANRNVAYRAMGDAADSLTAKGFTPEQAAYFLEDAATKYAVNATFRYTDQALEHSFFSELTDNFLMFQRAAEDFIKRFMTVSAANPAVLSKAFLLTEAGQHSGMIYTQTERNDETDEPESHLIFTFPGSGVLAKAVQETGQALGWGDSDLILKPLYSSMSSQLRFVNPSLTNPLGFSTNPIIGMPLRAVRSLWPETYDVTTDVLSKLEGGGERFFAEQSVMQSIMPTPLARLLPAFAPGAADGSLASATKNAFVYFGAAGLLPGADATDDEVEDAHNAIREMATNQLVWRAAVGAFSPWAPQYTEPDDLGLPEADAISQATGINSLRGEWFDVLRQASEKWGSAAAFSQANIEWARRHPRGLSIAEPGVFNVGTTRAPGTGSESGSFQSGPALTDWLLANKDWMLENKSVAYYLLPAFNEPQYTAAGARTQINNQLRVKKENEEFYRDVRQAIGEREWWDRWNARQHDLAAGGSPDRVYREWFEWERGWKTANPATARRQAEKQDPNYVHGEVIPALRRVVEENSAPTGVDKDGMRQVLEFYTAYRTKYNDVTQNSQAGYQRQAINKDYRDQGDRLFLGTPMQDLWKAINVYEVN